MPGFLIMIIALSLAFQCFSFGQYGKWTELHPTIRGNYPNNIFPNRWEFGMAQLTDKKVLMFGGSIYDVNLYGMSNDTWIYDYEENSWTQINTKNSPLPRDGMSIAQISEGKILLYGGYYYDYEVDTAVVLSDTWIFDSADSNWHEIKTEHSPGKRTGHGMAKLSDVKVMLFGGSPDETTFTNASYFFDLGTTDWQYIYNDETMPKPRCCFGISQLDEGKILISGGWNNYYLSDTWIFNENSFEWVQLNSTNNSTHFTDNPITQLTKIIYTCLVEREEGGILPGFLILIKKYGLNRI